MSLTPEQYDLLYESAIVAGTRAHRRYHTYFDAEDVTQDLMEWVLKRSKKYAAMLDTDNPDELRQTQRYLDKTFSRQADKICRSKKAQQLGYQLDDEAFYPAGLLSELLPFAFGEVVDVRDAQRSPRVSGGGSDPATAGNWIVSMFDVRAALDRLDPDDKLILFMRFDQNYTLEELSEALEFSTTTAHRKVEGALKRLSDLLGGESPWPRRKATSNAQARAETDAQVAG